MISGTYPGGSTKRILLAALLVLFCFQQGQAQIPSSRRDPTVSVKVTFRNIDTEPITVQWVDWNGKLNEPETILPGKSTGGGSSEGYVHIFKKSGKLIRVVTLSNQPEQLFEVRDAILDQSNMAVFIQRLRPEYVTGIAGLDEQLKKLLLETFEGDWTKAKECLLFGRWPVEASHPPHAAGIQLMEEMVKMRSRVCSDIAAKTQSKILAHLKDFKFDAQNPISDKSMAAAFYVQLTKGDARTHFNPLAPTGAEKRTSDIDVASNGLNTEIGVQLFNQTFRERLQVDWDAATVFDYNVYAADWIFPARFNEVKNNGDTELTPRPEHILELDAGAAPADDDRLQAERAKIFDNAGLLHIRRNCSENEWNSYIRFRTDSVDPQVVTQLQVVDAQFKSFKAEIDFKKLEIRQFICPPNSAWKNNDEYFDGALETRARNKIYETRLLKVKALRLHYQVLMAKNNKSEQDRNEMYTLAKQITEALTDAIFFANEVYATEGATLHATQAIQKVAKAQKQGIALRVNLTDAQYMQAFHENVGDSLHSLGHYANEPAYAVYRAGKYIDRMLLAAQVLTAKSASSAAALRNHSRYAVLKTLGDRGVVVKESADGDDPVKIREKAEFRSVNLEQLRLAILEIGGFLPGIISGKVGG